MNSDNSSSTFLAIVFMTMRQQLRGRRTPALLALAMIPLLIALYWAAESGEGAPKVFFFDFSYIVYFQFVIPVVTLIFGTSLIREEISSRMISYLVTNKSSRAQLLMGRFTGYVLPTYLVVALPILVAYVLVLGWRGTLSAGAGPLAVLLFAALCAVVAYGALYNLLGVYLKHPLMVGLLFAFIWETVLANLPGKIPYVTISFYLHSLVAGLSDVGETGLWEGGTSAPLAMLALICISSAMLWMSILRFRRMDVV